MGLIYYLEVAALSEHWGNFTGPVTLRKLLGGALSVVGSPVKVKEDNTIALGRDNTLW